MTWDPDRYLRFADHRARPGLDLMARLPDSNPRTVVDRCCGTGNLTAVLSDRWPDAHVQGLDSSAEMIERAREDHANVDWSVTDITRWEPTEPVDVIYSNAALHWLDDHATVFPRLRSYLADGGVIAIQMPDNWNAPTHRIPADVLDEGDWPAAAKRSLMRDRLVDEQRYAEWLQPADVDMWRTTYYQQLTGPDPVWAWVTGSVLRPVLASLAGEDRDRFQRICMERYRVAYPQAATGLTILALSRLFVVATAEG